MDKDKNIYVKIILIILIIITIGLLISRFIFERNTTVFYINGENKVILEVSDEYVEEGFVAKQNGKNISQRVRVTSNVNTNKVGTYKVSYNLSIKYLNINTTIIRKVYVKDTKEPKITINSDKEIDIHIGDLFEYPTYFAIDEYDGDLTNDVEVKTDLDLNKEGTYQIEYVVRDSSDNVATDKIVINVHERRKNPYVSVYISSQKLYYYEYDQLVLSSDIVTGINNATPTGSFKVLNKSRNVNLVGNDYISFVNYWIAFKGNSYGFHDASWRNNFGGNIYTYNGSHGCVNMPYYKVQQLYNLIEIGTPVYIYN